MSASTVFQVASISKSLTALGVLHLEEKGLVDLDVPVERYLRRWTLPASPFDHSKVTLRRILSHTAGLSLGGYPGTEPGVPLVSLEESLSGQNGSGIEVKVVQEPGRMMTYSGGGYTVAQLVIEEVTGMSFADFMAAAVLRPLDMTSSSFVWEQSLRPQTATAYATSNDPLPNFLFTETAAAGLYATPADLAKFVAAVARGSADDVVSRAAFSTMFDPQPSTSGAFGGYGIGAFVDETHTGRVVWHTGGNQGWSAIWAASPGSGDGIAVLTNSGTGMPLYFDLLCGWSRQALSGGPQLCKAINQFGTSATVATVLGAGFVATSATVRVARRRRLRHPRRPAWLAAIALLIVTGLWALAWYTPLATGGLFPLPPRVVLPDTFAPASLALMTALAARAVVHVRAPEIGPNKARVAIHTLAMSALWLVAVYSDAASRLFLGTTGLRPATVMRPTGTLIVLAVIVLVGAARSVRSTRRDHGGSVPAGSAPTTVS